MSALPDNTSEAGGFQQRPMTSSQRDARIRPLPVPLSLLCMCVNLPVPLVLRLGKACAGREVLGCCHSGVVSDAAARVTHVHDTTAPRCA